MQNIWQKLTKPIFCLAPMEDVTDFVFRELLTYTHRPDIFFTEFTNVEALNSEGYEATIKRLKFSKRQKPIIAQIWGLEPDNFYKTAQLVKKLGFDGVDINMGCPQRHVVKIGACSALITNQPLAKEIILATQKGAGDLPISVKTRIGYKTIVTEDWIDFLLDFNLSALTIHGRTQKEMSTAPVHWDEIQKSVLLRDKKGKDTLIIGNGDVLNYADGIQKIDKYNLDGIMIGRGIFQDLYAFSPTQSSQQTTIEKRIELLKKHLKLWDKTYKDTKPFSILKKYFKIYIRDFDGSAEFRKKLMGTERVEEALKILDSPTLF